MVQKKVFFIIAAVILIIILLLLKCPGGKKAVRDEIAKEPAAEEIKDTDEKEETDEKDGPEKIEPEPKKTVEVKKEPAKKAEKPKKNIVIVNITEKEGRQVLEIKKDGKTVLTKEVDEKTGFKVTEDKSVYEDLTGDGKPNFILQEYSEGESCANVFTVFTMDDDFEMKAQLSGLSEGIEFKDLDGDGVPELIGRDCTMLNWWATFGEDISPKVILKYNYGTYVFAEELMRKDAPLEPEMRKYAEENKGNFISYVWKYMTDLIYAGNGDAAWKFFDMVHWDDTWEAEITAKEGRRGTSPKEDFLEAYKEHLSTSPYWEDIKAFNSWQMQELMM
ncbi:MAG TPA: hypothetical protein ENN55_05580 [Firmicutes bacterium]|nr:hypothetical protein [Bacillota bacterium]